MMSVVDGIPMQAAPREVAGHELRLLLVEDSPADAEMVLWSLRRMPRRIRHVRVASEPALREALRTFDPHVVLGDFSMPGFGGHQALQVAAEIRPDVPFLFVSGTIGEEVAIEALKRGAVDYVLKDNLRRLPSAIERALSDARERCEHQRMQEALAESEERFRTIVETSRDWIWECDREGRLTYCNRAAFEIMGYAPEELIGTNALALLSDASRAEAAARLQEYAAGGTGWRDWRLHFVRRDGELRVLDSTSTPLLDAAGNTIGFRGIARDVTGRLRHEAKIRNLARIHAMLGAIGGALTGSGSRDDLLSQACRAAVDIGGFRAAGVGVLGEGDALRVVAMHGDPQFLAAVAPTEPMPVREPGPYFDHPSLRAFRENRRVAVHDFIHSDVEPSLRQAMLDSGVRSQISLPIGREPWALLALYSDASLGYDEEEVVLLQRLVERIDDAAAFLANAQRLQFFAYHHPLTGLPNAVALQDSLRKALRDQAMVLVAIDAPRLAQIATTRGKHFANRVLQALATRLQRPDELLAHADASTLLLAFPASGTVKQEALRLERRLGKAENTPLLIDDEQIWLGLCSGITVAPQGTTDLERLEADALTALASACRLGRRVAAYTAEMRQAARRLVELEHDLRRAIERGEFELYYQPKVDAGSGRIEGAEALLRWRHPEAGWIPPSEFIPVLEETGLIVTVGHWAMRQALATALDWRRRFAPQFRIAVNVSARELRHRTFLERRRTLLQPWTGNQPIDIEVTESTLMEDIDQVIPLLQSFRDLGCRVAIDDFGTGYSSLNYLVRLPVDTIKIDRSFVSGLNDSPETVALTTNIIALARALGMDLVAEGVEEETQAELLRGLHCDVLQGYLLGRPMPADAFADAFFAK